MGCFHHTLAGVNLKITTNRFGLLPLDVAIVRLLLHRGGYTGR